MAVFKCKMCGGALDITDESVVTCDYCGTQQTLPKLGEDDRRANLYDRANHFRRNNDFDKAMGIYEQILNDDGTDAEAYWSLVLCRYGIEYVEDPSSHKRIPTVNRAQFTSVFDDDNYRCALQYADSLQREIYEQEAKAINEIQKGILAISQKEEPFDVFICYKETDQNGRRTPDSVLANDLYHQLTQEGFKVFFSRITLEDKLGSAYEPYIFAALNSAKVMVVLGTKPEYFNAVWVKNEWSRYLALIKNGDKKMLIPAYRDMDPYDLPEEFSHLQAQDMSKLGFMQDLIRGIKKITAADEPKQTVVKETVVTSAGNANIAPLLKRAFMFLEDGEWDRADDFCEQVLNLDPECAEAYLGKLMVEVEAKQREELADCNKPFDGFNNYVKIMRFASPGLKAEMEGYIAHIIERNENARKEEIYKEAKQTAYRGQIYHYETAIRNLQNLNGWKDSEELIAKYREKIKEIKEIQEAERLERERLEEIARKEEEKRAKRNRTLTIITSLIAIALVIFVLLWESVISPAMKYNEAVKLMEDGKYNEAISVFEELNGYRDSNNKIEHIKFNDKYNNALSLMENGKHKEAISVFKSLDGYRDSNEKIEHIINDKYNNALSLMENGKYQEAISEFEELDGYKDSNEKIKIIKLKIMKQGDYIFFGNYEQDNNTSNGKEEIEWLVLDITSNRALVICKYALDYQQYNASNNSIDWETCSLRRWLNDEFMNAAFSENEQNMIYSSTIIANGNPQYSTNPGNNTQDKIFLLSIDEKEKYFNSSSARCKASNYTDVKGATSYSYYSYESCCWWLRSPGSSQKKASNVLPNGSIRFMGSDVNEYNAVRPAMWIDISEIE